MLSGGPHQLTKDKFVLAKIPSNVHMQNKEVKLDESLYRYSLFSVNGRIIHTILTTRGIIRLILQPTSSPGLFP